MSLFGVLNLSYSWVKMGSSSPALIRSIGNFVNMEAMRSLSESGDSSCNLENATFLLLKDNRCVDSTLFLGKDIGYSSCSK